MTNPEFSDSVRLKIDAAVGRLSLLASGRHDALQFAWKAHGNLEAIRAEIAMTETEIAHPPKAFMGAMAPTASPRIYKEGYLAGLSEAIEVILACCEGST